VIIQENIFLSLKGSLNNLLFEKYLKGFVDHPAFLRFLTKKSFSLVRTSSLDFSNSFLILGFKSFFGEKWTKKFINKFLFTLNNEIIH